jgi:hypothetical protein
VTSPASRLEPGSMMHTVLLGAPVGDRIRTWDEEGPRDWLVDHPETLAVLLGRGQVSRTEVEPSRFREAGLLAADEGVLLLPPRFADKGSVEPAAFRVRAAGSLDMPKLPTGRGSGTVSMRSRSRRRFEASSSLSSAAVGHTAPTPTRSSCVTVLEGSGSRCWRRRPHLSGTCRRGCHPRRIPGDTR